MNVELINPFIVSTINVIKTMAATDPIPGKPELKKDNLTFGCITGLIGMMGDKMTGNMIISFDEPCILSIVSKMLMEEFHEVNDVVIDAVGEITNMITGGAKKILSEGGHVFEMATPMMLRGKDMELKQLSKSPVITIPFSTPAGKFVVEANLAAGSAKQ